jgi:hypothetical protein
MDKYDISYTSIDTNSLSSCIGLLLHGHIDKEPFCLLSHISQHHEFNGDDLYQILIDLLQDLLIKLRITLGIDLLSSEANIIKNMMLLIAGGPIGHHEIARKSLTLLNDDSNSILNEIRTRTGDPDIIHLANELYNAVILISPITYLTTNEHETKG